MSQIFERLIAQTSQRKAAGRPRKLPSREEVVRLYVEEGLSSTDIAQRFGLTSHKPVTAQLERAGVPRRRSGPSHNVCMVPGCEMAAYKVRHTNNGSMYGTMCEPHREAHRRIVNRLIQQRNRGISPDRQEPWRWYENLDEELVWIYKNKRQLKSVRSMVNHMLNREACNLLKRAFEPAGSSQI